MKAVDTNVIIRFLVRDDEKQAQAVYRLFKTVETNRDMLLVPLLVVLEAIWVLEAVYSISRRNILDSLETLLLMPILKFEAQPAIRQFIVAARDSNVELSDLLIAAAARVDGCDRIFTFDKAACRDPYFEMVT
ncbi:MAG: PIN domain-containing protein [Thermodesulfobacteriota bacterium]